MAILIRTHCESAMKKYLSRIVEPVKAEEKRMIIGVKPDDADDPREVDFAYTSPKVGINEPVLLCSYPSIRTLKFLLNEVADFLGENGWSNVQEDAPTLLGGFLGEKGELPVALRALTEYELEAARDAYVLAANPELPVLLLTVPDVEGVFPWEKGCKVIVRLSEEKLVGTLNA